MLFSPARGALPVGAALLVALVGFVAKPVTERTSGPELWYWHHSYLTSDDTLSSTEALLRRAAAAGYTGVVFWDSSYNHMGLESWAIENEYRMHDAMHYANKLHLKAVAMTAPFGWSNDILNIDPNWAEAQRVINARFQVDKSGRRLNYQPAFPGLENPGFESGKTVWFSLNDPGVELSSDAHHGKFSVVIAKAPGNARLRQKVTLIPWHQYRLSLWFKSVDFQGGPMVELLSEDASRMPFNVSLRAGGTQPWTPVEYLFNSQDLTSVNLYLGVWGGSSGAIYFDDVQLEDTALVYVEHRAGAPFRLYDPANPAVEFKAGSDYILPVDKAMTPDTASFQDNYHPPPPFTLPASTRLVPGQIVAADFYAVTPLAALNQTGVCLTEPAVYKWLEKNAKAVKKALPRDSAVLLSYDEIRQANSCFACRSRNLTAGQLLAASVQQTLAIYRSVIPDAPIFIWSDMFDPYHNAHDSYYYVEGDLSGSWKGLPPEVSIMNWNLEHLHDSLAWFSGLDPRQPVGHKQMIAGYYDTHNGAKAAADELKDASGIPGVIGMMYTTYADDYTQLESFASAFKKAWPEYVASLKK